MIDLDTPNKSTKQSFKIFSRENTMLIFILLLAALIGLLLAGLLLFYSNLQKSDTIQSGVFIKGINVSGLTKDEAKILVHQELRSNMNDHIVLTYKGIEYYVEIEQIEASFDIDKAVDYAYNIARSGNFFTDMPNYLYVLMTNINLDLDLLYNDEMLNRYIEQIQAILPDQLTQSDYYTEDDKLYVTNGTIGAKIQTDILKTNILYAIQDISYNNKSIEIPTTLEYPEPINVLEIHKDIHKDMQNAYYTTEPYAVFADVTGVDFNMNYLLNSINEDRNAEEYSIDLVYTYPDVTIQDLGQDAFPNLLGKYTTKYVSNANRTTNLRLASNKIDGYVLMPGETFSYNQTVGKRTIAEGYKNAAIYENGEVTDGVGGGICQISSTLYNAIVAADLEIMERHNHTFVSTYVPAGQDATVAWGSLDFKFRNNRDYPIKISSNVSDGYATVKIYGLAREVEYDQKLETTTIKNTATSLVVDSYRVLRLNGNVVEKRRIFRDTYKKH